jgi:hypothetical protein
MLLSVPPTENGWAEFWYSHWQDHLEIQKALQVQKGNNLPIYIIDPWVDSDADGILGIHQNFHDDFNGVLQLGSQDVSSIDFKDPESVRQFLYQNWQEHQAARSALGI